MLVVKRSASAGLGDAVNRRDLDKIVNRLLQERVLHVTKGDEGDVYIPNREYTKRMEAILNQLTLSEDPLWKWIEHQRW